MKMSLRERFAWAASLLLLGSLLPSLLQLRVELRGWRHSLSDALHAVATKWLLPYDSLQSITLACLVPFVFLAIFSLCCAHAHTRRGTIRFTLAGLALVLVVWVPLGIHHLKLAYSDDTPPFIMLHFAGVSVISTLLLLVLTPALLALAEFHEPTESA